MLATLLYACFWSVVGLVGAVAGMAFVMGFKAGKS